MPPNVGLAVHAAVGDELDDLPNELPLEPEDAGVREGLKKAQNEEEYEYYYEE